LFGLFKLVSAIVELVGREDGVWPCGAGDCVEISLGAEGWATQWSQGAVEGGWGRTRLSRLVSGGAEEAGMKGCAPHCVFRPDVIQYKRFSNRGVVPLKGKRGGSWQSESRI
jgi:hypothetical protein